MHRRLWGPSAADAPVNYRDFISHDHLPPLQASSAAGMIDNIHLARRVQDDFVPLLRQVEDFRSYYLLDGGPDVLITISIFDGSDAAFASKRRQTG